MNVAERYHSALSVSPSTSSSPRDRLSPPAGYGSREYAAAHLPPAEFMRRYSAGPGTPTEAGAKAWGRLSPRSRRIAKRGERRERRAVLKKLRAMVGGMDDQSSQLQIVEHVIERIRELQTTLSAAAGDAPMSPPPPAAAAAGLSPAESLASLDSLAWASGSAPSSSSGSGSDAEEGSPDSALGSPALLYHRQQQQQQQQQQEKQQAAQPQDVQLLILQLSSVLGSLLNSSESC